MEKMKEWERLFAKKVLLARAKRNAETGCLELTTKNGEPCITYGLVTLADGKQYAAHRMSWRVFKGPIPDVF
jgi:hypothetical protein